jgi:hypothetical protein
LDQAVAKDAADGILALEQNWVGPIANNDNIGQNAGSLEKTGKRKPSTCPATGDGSNW